MWRFWCDDKGGDGVLGMARELDLVLGSVCKRLALLNVAPVDRPFVPQIRRSRPSGSVQRGYAGLSFPVYSTLPWQARHLL